MERPEDFWNARYAEEGWAYGTEPNAFVRECAPLLPAGPALCLGEGQGRNAVFLAGRGFAVTALDQSPVGLARARSLAAERGVALTTVVADLETFAIAPRAWSAIVSVFIHLPPALRRRVHRAVVEGLAPGGAFVFEAYGPRQIALGTGGPQDPERVPGLDVLRGELGGLDLEIAREQERDVIEGRYHTGRAHVVEVLARRPAG